MDILYMIGYMVILYGANHLIYNLMRMKFNWFQKFVSINNRAGVYLVRTIFTRAVIYIILIMIVSATGIIGTIAVGSMAIAHFIIMSTVFRVLQNDN